MIDSQIPAQSIKFSFYYAIIIHYIIENCNSNISQSEFLQGIFLGHLVNLREILGGFCNFRLLICHRLVICKLLINFTSYNILWYFEHLRLYKDSRYFRTATICGGVLQWRVWRKYQGNHYSNYWCWSSYIKETWRGSWFCNWLVKI